MMRLIGTEQIDRLTEIEKAWLACALDGEGTIYWKSSKLGGVYPTVRIYNTNIEFIQYAAKLIGRHYGAVRERRCTNNSSTYWQPHHKKCYAVSVYGRPAQAVLREIMPYLIIKKERALLAVSGTIRTREEWAAYLNSHGTKWRGKDGRYCKEMEAAAKRHLASWHPGEQPLAKPEASTV